MLSGATLPSATLLILLPAASIPDLVTLGPPVIVKPSLLMVVSPAVTLPVALTLVTLIVSFNLKVTLLFSLVIWILSLALLKSTVASGAIFDLFSPLFTDRFQPLLAISFTSFNCETFTASVSSVPAATPVIFLSPALIPDLVTLGPPLTVKPSLLMVVSPALTLSTLRSLFNLT